MSASANPIGTASSDDEVSLKDKLNETLEQMEVARAGRIVTTAICSFTETQGKYALVARFVSVPNELVDGLSAVLADVTDAFMAKYCGASGSPIVH
jgi:hypothetical protein